MLDPFRSSGGIVSRLVWNDPLPLLAILAVPIVFFFSAFGMRNMPDTNAARQAYESGNYQSAEELFNRIAQTGVAPGLLHNLGNTEFKLGHPGEAILAWERARTLDPWNRNTAANLRFARGQAGLQVPNFAWYEAYSSWLSPDTWLWTAAACFWGGLACLCLPLLLRRRRTAWTQAGAVVAISTFLLTLPALAGLWTRARLGVVLAADTTLRLTPTEEGEVLGKLPAGELARVELERGNYLYVRAEPDRAGWLRRDEFARIWAR
jgi:hypothetical protein